MSAELRPRIKIVTQLNKNEVIEKIKQKVDRGTRKNHRQYEIFRKSL